jgi:hypothetical protein
MLFLMASATHFTSLAAKADIGGGSLGGYWLIALVVILGVELNALIGPGAATQKPLTSVSGTIQAGFILAIVLYAVQSGLL